MPASATNSSRACASCRWWRARRRNAGSSGSLAPIAQRGYSGGLPESAVMILLHRLIPVALVALGLAVPPATRAQTVAAAADADLIAVYSHVSEKRLLRVRYDRAAGKA